MLLASPTGPTCVMVGPMAVRNGRARSSTDGSPPTMNDSCPASSVAGLPDTGASSSAAPRAAASSASRPTTVGLTVLISIRIAPGRSPASRPCGPRATASRAASSVTMVKTASDPRAASRGDGASVIPACTRGAAFAAVRL